MLNPVPHMSSSSYRDRTSEFHSVAERLRKSGAGVAANGDAGQAARSNAEKSGSASSVISLQSEFNKKASRIGLSIHQTTQKLDKLAKRASFKP
jgi:syntaxin 5